MVIRTIIKTFIFFTEDERKEAEFERAVLYDAGWDYLGEECVWEKQGVFLFNLQKDIKNETKTVDRGKAQG